MTLEQAIARLWPAAKRVSHAELPGGITNKNHRVDVDGVAFVVRLPGADTHLLGIDRAHEHAASLAAARVGVGPEVVQFLADAGVLVTRFIDGKRMPPEELRKPANLRKFAASLRKFHDGASFPGRFSPFRTVDDYLRHARAAGVASFPADLDALLDHLREIEEALATRALPPRPCHNDLLNENFIDDGTIRILDWEYAGMGDAFFDLANFAVHHELADGDERALLEAYFGRADAPDHARLKLLKLASDFREAMWGMVQVGISKLDFDFQGYADRHFGRFRRNRDDSRVAGWLTQCRS